MKLSKDHKKHIIKLIIFVLLLFLLFVLIKINYKDAERKKSLGNTLSDIATLNNNQIFSIDKIYLYSSADAVNNNQNSVLDLNIYQYTDIAIYISSNSDKTDESTIKELYIDNIQFDTLESGSSNLYYKNILDFGKFNLNPENRIVDRLTYNVLPVTNTNIDYSKPEVYSNLSNSINLEYLNLIKSNYLISDVENPVTYNGSLLKRCGITLNSIANSVSFKIHIKNNLDELHTATVRIDIPLKDDANSKSIYDGDISKELKNTINFVCEK